MIGALRRQYCDIGSLCLALLLVLLVDVSLAANTPLPDQPSKARPFIFTQVSTTLIDRRTQQLFPNRSLWLKIFQSSFQPSLKLFNAHGNFTR